MKIYKKNTLAPIKKASDEAVEEKKVKKVKATDDAEKAEDEKAEDEDIEEFTDESEAPVAVTLSEDEIAQIKDVLPALIEMLPKIVQLLTGEATIEIIDDEEEDTTIEENDMEESGDNIEVVDEDESEAIDEEDLAEVEEDDEKADDDAGTFNAAEVLNDPVKRAAIEKVLKENASATTSKVEDSVTPAPKKVFVKKTLAKKAGDETVIKTKPNAELVKAPVEKRTKIDVPTVRTFDFHKARSE